MLAYGRSRRTLRFSFQDERSYQDQGSLAATDELLDLHSTSAPLYCQRNAQATQKPSPNPANPSKIELTPIVKSVGRAQIEDDQATMKTAEKYVGGSSMNSYDGRPRRSGENLTSQGSGKRPQFRLEMDLGLESDSSEDDGDLKDFHNPSIPGKQRAGAVEVGQWKSDNRTIDRISRGHGRTKNIDERDHHKMRPTIQRSSGHVDHWSDVSLSENGLSQYGDSREGVQPQRAPSASVGGVRKHLNAIEYGWTQGPLVTPDHPPNVYVPDQGTVERTESPRPLQCSVGRQLSTVRNPYGSRPASQPVAVTPDVTRGRGGDSMTPGILVNPTEARRTGLGGHHPNKEPIQPQGDSYDEGTLRQATSLVDVQHSYPPELSRIWPFRKFNPVQSALYPTISKSDRNVVVSAPTGCGKTVVLEMAVARLLHESGMSLANRKIIYIAPIKALCQQILDDWTAKFSPLGVRLAELTSDSSTPTVSLRDLASADIILTTPEKWDSVTRRWKEHAFLVGAVALVLVDEVHTIGEERGATLEVIITRMKLISRSQEVVVKMGLAASRMRFVALSATLPNATDIGEFIGAEVFRFGSEFRPVPLQTHVMGYSAGSNPFLFDRGLTKHVPGLVARYSNGKPSLIFCGSKKDTETLAGSLVQSKDYARGTGSQVVVQYLSRAADEAQDPQLAKFIRKGVAIHNSGLSPGDRGLVERAFLSGSLTVLVATTTLALGVNLPARLVIIKGTNHYRGGAKGYQELPRSALLQMIGRAGRPGFDSSGVAVVMTSQANKKELERLSSGQEAVESSLQARLLEALNSEVCQGETIHDVGEAIEWLRSTFYFIRCKKNPSFYGVPSSLSDVGLLHGHMQTMCLDGLKQLRDAGVIAMDEDEFAVIPTPHGVLFSRFMVRFESMKAIMGVKEDYGTKDILKMCAGCDELNVPVRRAEKRALNELNKKVRFPPPKKEIVRTPADKALVLLQAALGGLPLEDWTLRGEQAAMLEVSARLLACCAESLAVCGRGGGLGCAVALRLTRSVRLKMWMDAELGQLRQLPGVGDTMCIRLAGGQIVTLVDLARASSAKVDSIAGRKHPFGHGIRHAALHFLSRGLTPSVSRRRTGDGKDELQVRVEPMFQSENPFEDRYIEAPDPAHAPPSTGWRRFDTHFQLLAYYDPDRAELSRDTVGENFPASSGQEDVGGKKKASSTVPSSHKSSYPSIPSETRADKGPLLLFRKVTQEGLHCTVIPSEVVKKNLTIHLWMICSGVCGMDIADIRMKPSTLDDSFMSVQNLRRIWSEDAVRPDHGDGSDHEGDGQYYAADRGRWGEWEQDNRASATRWVSSAGSSASSKVHIANSKYNPRLKEGEYEDSGSSAKNGRDKRKRSAASGRRGRVNDASDGMRQMDIASSFKAGTQRALIDSARKRSRSSGDSPREGLSKGELGAIGVAEAGDNLGVSPGALTATQEKGQRRKDTKSKTPSKQQKSAGRTWSSMAKQSGSIFGASAVGGSPGTYDPAARALRTVLTQKGSEMNLSSLVGVDRLGRAACGGGAFRNTTVSPSTPQTSGRRPTHSGITGGAVSSSHGSTSGSTSLAGVDQADGHAAVDLTRCLSDSLEVPRQTSQPEQEMLRHHAVDFSAFAFNPMSSRAPSTPLAPLARHSTRKQSTEQGANNHDYGSKRWGARPTEEGALDQGEDERSDAREAEARSLGNYLCDGESSAGSGSLKAPRSHLQRQSRGQQYQQQQRQLQGYSYAREEFSVSSRHGNHSDSVAGGRPMRSWDDLTRQRGRGKVNVAASVETRSGCSPEAMLENCAPRVDREFAQLEGDFWAREESASPLSSKSDACAVSSAASFFGKKSKETTDGSSYRRRGAKAQGQYEGDGSNQLNMHTLAPVVAGATFLSNQAQSTPSKPLTSAWPQHDRGLNPCIGSFPSRGVGNVGAEGAPRMATPLPTRPNTSLLSTSSIAGAIVSGGKVERRGAAMTSRAQNSLDHHQRLADSGGPIDSAQWTTRPKVTVARGETETIECHRKVVHGGDNRVLDSTVNDAAMESNGSDTALLERDRKGAESLHNSSETAIGASKHEITAQGPWRLSNCFTGRGAFEWACEFGGLDKCSETVGYQGILEPIRPATPPTMRAEGTPSGGDGDDDVSGIEQLFHGPSGHIERGSKDGVYHDKEGEVLIEKDVRGAEEGDEFGGDVAKKLVFHEIFD